MIASYSHWQHGIGLNAWEAVALPSSLHLNELELLSVAVLQSCLRQDLLLSSVQGSA